MATDANSRCNGCLTPYAASLVFLSAVLLTTPPIVKLLMVRPVVGVRMHACIQVRPLVGDPSSCSEYYAMAGVDHGWGLIGGAVWATGTLSNLLSGSSIGLALSYSIGQAAPMVATAWGVFYYREFERSTVTTKLLIGGCFLWYTVAILLCASSK